MDFPTCPICGRVVHDPNNCPYQHRIPSDTEILVTFRRKQRLYDRDGFGFETALNAAKDALRAWVSPEHVESVVLTDEAARHSLEGH